MVASLFETALIAISLVMGGSLVPAPTTLTPISAQENQRPWSGRLGIGEVGESALGLLEVPLHTGMGARGQMSRWTRSLQSGFKPARSTSGISPARASYRSMIGVEPVARG